MFCTPTFLLVLVGMRAYTVQERTSSLLGYLVLSF